MATKIGARDRIAFYHTESVGRDVPHELVTCDGVLAEFYSVQMRWLLWERVVAKAAAAQFPQTGKGDMM